MAFLAEPDVFHWVLGPLLVELVSSNWGIPIAWSKPHCHDPLRSMRPNADGELFRVLCDNELHGNLHCLAGSMMTIMMPWLAFQGRVRQQKFPVLLNGAVPLSYPETCAHATALR